MLETINRKPLINGLADDGLTPTEDLKGSHGGSEIELRGVNFAYPARPEINVCNQYSLRIEPGQTVALVGASGSGKSTIVQLLLRFYDPQEGAVLLDGKDLRSLNVRWLRSQIGYVGQEPVLFAGTIADNIAYGLSMENSDGAAVGLEGGSTLSDGGAGAEARVGVAGGQSSASKREEVMERVIAAAKLSNAHDFISAFPDGYHTDVGSNGESMSGGTRL